MWPLEPSSSATEFLKFPQGMHPPVCGPKTMVRPEAPIREPRCFFQWWDWSISLKNLFLKNFQVLF
jgi:hypothetical protein